MTMGLTRYERRIEERELIEAHLARQGVTRLPTSRSKAVKQLAEAAAKDQRREKKRLARLRKRRQRAQDTS